MLNLITLFGVLLVIAARSQASHTRAQEQALHAMYDECSEDLDIPAKEHFFAVGHFGNLTRKDAKAIPFVFCVMIRMEFIDCEGTIGKQRLVDFFTDGHDVSALPGVIDECNTAATGKTIPEWSFNFYKCFFAQKKFVI